MATYITYDLTARIRYTLPMPDDAAGADLDAEELAEAARKDWQRAVERCYASLLEAIEAVTDGDTDLYRLPAEVTGTAARVEEVPEGHKTQAAHEAATAAAALDELLGLVGLGALAEGLK